MRNRKRRNVLCVVIGAAADVARAKSPFQSRRHHSSWIEERKLNNSERRIVLPSVAADAVNAVAAVATVAAVAPLLLPRFCLLPFLALMLLLLLVDTVLHYFVLNNITLKNQEF